MSTFKCKMCGGTLEIKNGSTVAECEYCGAKQTLPKLDDEKRANLYDRANHFRRLPLFFVLQTTTKGETFGRASTLAIINVVLAIVSNYYLFCGITSK